MKWKAAVGTFGLLAITFGVGAQQGTSSKPSLPLQANPIPMPADRAVDSYALYSQLLPHSGLEGGAWTREYWLLSDTTDTMAPTNVSCTDPKEHLWDDPREAVEAPEDRQRDLQELFQDFVQHCHDRIQLKLSAFAPGLALHLADDAATKRYVKTRSFDKDVDPATLAEFKGAAGLHSFSEVYFNKAHTLAMVHAGLWCGNLCGNWQWQVLERKDNEWKPLSWVHRFTIS
jgi:hypothetical protein